MSEYKVCTKCGDRLMVDCFSRDRTKKDGLRPSCRDCSSKQKKESHLRNRDKILLRQAKYRELRREELSSKERERRRNFTYAERMEDNRKHVERNKKNPGRHQEAVAVGFANAKAKKLCVAGKLLLKSWRDLKRANKGICLCCGKGEPEISITIDHIVPFSKGGLNVIENIQPLCGHCNKSKGSKVEQYGVIESKVKQNAEYCS